MFRDRNVETLYDELMELTESAANGDADLEKIDAYLTALDKKEPLPFEIDVDFALEKFHDKHGLLLKLNRSASPMANNSHDNRIQQFLQHPIHDPREDILDELTELTIRENRTEKENDRLNELYVALDQHDSET